MVRQTLVRQALIRQARDDQALARRGRIRGAITRLVAAAALTAAVVALAISPGSPASAAPKAAATPTSVQIVGTGVTNKIVVDKATQAVLFQRLYGEVNWLATTKGQTTAPATAKLGAKYTLTVYVNNKPTQAYDLYPMAVGGPRVHRAAKQPGGKKATDGWFFGSLGMPASLQASGAPLQAKPDVVSAGIGAGTGTDIESSNNFDPASGVSSFLNQMRRLFLLNGALLIVILFGLAGIAFMIRRRV